MTRLMWFLAAVMISSPTLAWDGTDVDSGGTIEIGKGNLVREGLDIEVYDYESGAYRDVTVEDMSRSGSNVEIEVYDSGSGEYRTFEMEDD